MEYFPSDCLSSLAFLQSSFIIMVLSEFCWFSSRIKKDHQLILKETTKATGFEISMARLQGITQIRRQSV